MIPARRRFLSPDPVRLLLSLLVGAALACGPVAAQGELELRHPGQPLHPILGGITDDGGPFNRVVWGEATVVSQWARPEEAIRSAEVPAGEPTLHFNPVSGQAVALWVTGDGIVISRFAVGGWTAPVIVDSGAPGASPAADPVLAFDPLDGAIHLAYATPSDGGVWLVRASADLSTWSRPERVSREREYATHPALTLDGRRISIAYESHPRGPRSTPRDIVIAQADLAAALAPGLHAPGSRRFVRTTLATTYLEGESHLRLDSEDTESADGDGGRLLVRWMTAEGVFGWTLQARDGTWGPVGEDSLAAPAVPGANRAVRGRDLPKR